MYITSDPSSPSGAPYVPIMVTFRLPKIGTGLMFPENPNIFNIPVPCNGCDEVWAEIAAVQKNFNDKVHHQEMIYGTELTACLLVIFVPVIIIAVVVFARKLQNYDPSSYPSTPQKRKKRLDEPSLWGDLFERENKKVQSRTPLNPHVVPDSNFEDQNF